MKIWHYDLQCICITIFVVMFRSFDVVILREKTSRCNIHCMGCLTLVPYVSENNEASLKPTK